MLKKRLCLFVIVALILSGCSTGDKTTTEETSKTESTSTTEDTTTESTETTTEEPAAEEPATEVASEEVVFSLSEEQVIIEEEGIKVTLKGLGTDDYGDTVVNLLIENESEKNVIVGVDNASINDIMVYASLYAEVAAGKKANEAISFYTDDLASYGITTIQDIDLIVSAYDSDSYDDIFVTDRFVLRADAGADFVQEINSEGTVLVDQDGIKVVAQSFVVDGDYNKVMKFYVENNTDQTVVVTNNDTSVNGFMVTGSFYATLFPGTKEFVEMDFYDDDFAANDITEVEEVDFTINAYDNYTYDDLFVTDVITVTK